MAQLNDKMFELRDRLDDAIARRDHGAAADARHGIERTAQEIADVMPAATREQETARRSAWVDEIEPARSAAYQKAADRLHDAMAAAESAVLAAAEAAVEVSAIAEAHRIDGRRPQDNSGVIFGDPLARAADGTVLHAVDPAAVVLAIAAVGLTAGNAARSWPVFLDQAQGVRRHLVLPARSSNKETSS